MKNFHHLKPLQKRAHWKTSPVKIGVPIRLCELKQGFKDYRHLSVPSELWAANLQFFCLTPLSRQYRYNRRINHCFEVSKCRFHRERLQSVKYLICEMNVVTKTWNDLKPSTTTSKNSTNIQQSAAHGRDPLLSPQLGHPNNLMEKNNNNKIK